MYTGGKCNFVRLTLIIKHIRRNNMQGIPLTALKKGQQAVIQYIDDETVGAVLNEMGFLPQQVIILENIAPLGDPLIINNGDYSLSIRTSEARHILVTII